KFRRDRRPGLAIEPRWKFYPKYAAETMAKVARWLALGAKLHWTYQRVKRHAGYTDAAITSVAEDNVGREAADADVLGGRQRSAVH
ncbi:MAG TPA: radical SAM protein, partial [Thermoanaerobaculia bacterium]|nr:radical SAM protein [Thermoanaerobaculia bacterium]